MESEIQGDGTVFFHFVLFCFCGYYLDFFLANIFTL